MKLYLVRDAVACEHREPSDGLDGGMVFHGRKRFRKAALGLARLAESPAAVLTSPLPEAVETAVILQTAAQGVPAIVVCEALGPAGQPGMIASDCVQQGRRGREQGLLRQDLVLVGHAPSIGLLAAWFIDGETAASALPLRAGGVACLAFEGDPAPGSGELRWLVTPHLLRLVAG
jgi:phosphohistidine phosphatase SixA